MAISPWVFIIKTVTKVNLGEYIMKIKVTQECIDKGRRYETRRCPIAIAIRKATSTVGWEVYRSVIYHKGQSTFTTSRVKSFINKFDLYGKKGVLPCEFDICVEKLLK